jgi:TrmH family RNA methyltransferase
VGELVTSSTNPRVKLVRLLQTRRGRDRERAFSVEGEDLVEAGLRAGWTLRCALVQDGAAAAGGLADRIGERRLVRVPEALLADVSTLGHPARVIGVFEQPYVDHELAGAQASADAASVYLDGVQDPGNVGTAVRSAQAFDAAAVLLGPDTADPYSPKATRASMGAVFHVPVAQVREPVAPPGALVVLTHDAPAPIWDVDLGPAPVLCVGSERRGVSSQLRARADIAVSVPQSARALDSLNAGVVASLALYEWSRQRAAAQKAAATQAAAP